MVASAVRHPTFAGPLGNRLQSLEKGNAEMALGLVMVRVQDSSS
jgi:hypothetical protein